MASTKKSLHENLRNKYLEKITEFFKATDEEVLRTGTNEIAFSFFFSMSSLRKNK